MTREELTDKAIELFEYNKNLLLEFPTGSGKTKISLELYNKVKGNCLVVVAERVHINNWKEDIKKHGFTSLLPNITFICYASLHKYIGKEYNIVILDEAHHIQSLKRMEAISNIKYSKCILLTATITFKEKKLLETNIGKLVTFQFSLSEAINSDILPAPKIHLIPLELSNILSNQTIIISRGKEPKQEITCNYKDNWKKFLSMYKNIKLTLNCTELEKYQYLCSQIEYFELAYYKTPTELNHNKWMQCASSRKKYLGELKTRHIKKLINKYSDRYICFCSSIKQANEVGTKGSIIHSKITKSDDIINKFNSKKINSLFAVEMLREGMNLVDANVIIVQLDSKNRSALQMVGQFGPYYFNSVKPKRKVVGNTERSL